MPSMHVVLAGGSCGNTLYLIEDQLKESFAEWGFDVRLTTQSIWQRFDLPAGVDLVLQTLPAYKSADLECELISVRRMIRDRQDQETLGVIRSRLESIAHQSSQIRDPQNKVGEMNG